MNLKMRLLSIFTSTRHIKFGEIKYFHPSGRTTLPNGHPIQKGAFIHECHINSNSFESSFCRGYCIVLPSNQDLTYDGIKACIVETDSSDTYTIGNYFNGKYIADTDEIFNDNSISISVKGISNKKLTKLVEHLLTQLPIERLLIRNSSNNKIFITHRTCS